MVCAHDSSVNSITVTSKRPQIIKLHGDYLFEDIKATLRETESLEENMKQKFIEFCKDYGLIVIGYNGSDRSILDTFDYLLKKDDYLKNTQINLTALFVGYTVNFTFASDMLNNTFWITVGLIYAVPLVYKSSLETDNL